MYGLIESVAELVKIPSVTGDRKACQAALSYMLAKGREFGFHTETAVDGRVGIIEYGEGEETLGIITHVDVAHQGDMRKWEHHPFEATIYRQRLYGRGVLDNKGPAMAALYAMRDVAINLEQAGRTTQKKIRMIIGSEEGTGCQDVLDYLKDHNPPDYSFTPDGHFPIGNREKSQIHVLLSFPIDLDHRVIHDILAGVDQDTVPDLCKVRLANGQTLTTYGKACHASHSEHGENAIFKMAEVFDQLTGRDKMKIRLDSTYRVLMDLLHGFTETSGIALGIPQGSGRFHGEPTGKSHFAPTAMFTRDGKLFVNVSGHVAADLTEEAVCEALKQYFRYNHGEIERSVFLQGSYVSRRVPFVTELAESYAHLSGLPAGFTVSSVGSYALAVPNTVVYGPVFPKEVDERHCSNESIALRDLTFLEMLFERTMRKIVMTDRSYR